MKGFFKVQKIISLIILFVMLCIAFSGCYKNSSKISDDDDLEVKTVTLLEDNINNEFDTINNKINDCGTLEVSQFSSNKGIFSSIAEGFHTSIVDESRFISILKGVGITVVIILLTIIIGFIFGLSLFLLVYFSNHTVSKIMSKILEIFTLLPVSTWLLICYYIIFPAKSLTGFWVAVFGLSFSYGFTTLKCFLNAFDNVSEGEKQACVTMGYSKARALRKIYFPQMFPRFLSSMLDEVIYHIRDTSIVGFIAVQDIQAVADSISAETGEPFFPIILTAIVYMTICFIMTYTIKKIRKKISPESLDKKQIKKRIFRGAKDKKENEDTLASKVSEVHHD